MEIASIAVAKRLETHPPAEEPISERIRSNDRMTIAAAVRQITIERMAILGKPSEAVLAHFLSQLARSDVDVVVNIMKFALRTTVRSYRYLMMRFRHMVRAAKCIRLFWLSSRFRFAEKMQRLVLQWRRDEDEARKKLLNRSKKRSNAAATGNNKNTAKSSEPNHSKGTSKHTPTSPVPPSTSSAQENEGGEEDDFTLQQFISLQAPVELKRRVLLKQYKFLSNDYRLRWRMWRQRKADIERQVADVEAQSQQQQRHGLGHSGSTSRMSQDDGGGVSSAVLASRVADIPPEPKFKWFEQLSALSAGERFEMCLQYQLKRSTTHASHAGAGDADGMDDGWIALSLAAVARHARQIEERVMHGNSGAGGVGGGPIMVSFLPKFRGVKSKVMSSGTHSGNEGSIPRRGGGDAMQQQLQSASTTLSATHMLDLKAELPNLARFKSQPWNVPPRAQGVVHVSPHDRDGHRHKEHSHHENVVVAPQRELPPRGSESPSLGKLDPFARSLVLRGIIHPPVRVRTGSRSSSSVCQRRTELMSNASIEIDSRYRKQRPEDLLKGDRFREMLFSQEPHTGGAGK